MPAAVIAERWSLVEHWARQANLIDRLLQSTQFIGFGQSMSTKEVRYRAEWHTSGQGRRGLPCWAHWVRSVDPGCCLNPSERIRTRLLFKTEDPLAWGGVWGRMTRFRHQAPKLKIFGGGNALRWLNFWGDPATHPPRVLKGSLIRTPFAH